MCCKVISGIGGVGDTLGVSCGAGVSLIDAPINDSALYVGMAKVLPIIDVVGYDGQNSSFYSPYSDSTPITKKGSCISS